MSNFVEKMILSLIFIFIYCLLFYFLQTSQLRLDFASFYSAAAAYAEGANPYTNLVASYLSTPTKLPANLNPPFFLQLLSPLTSLNFQLVSSIWYLCSFILGIIGALLSFKLSCSEDFFKKYKINLLFIYLGMYPTFINAGIGQVGSILLFFIMTGYYFYLQKQDYLAGTFWGFIIAIKLFPALLFLFVLSQKRYKVLIIMLMTCLLAFLLPCLVKGVAIYSLYFNMLPRVAWFGDNWNASLYGFLFRLFIDVKSLGNSWLIQCIYLVLFSLLLLWYIQKIKLFSKTSTTHPLDHRGFGFTLIMMLFLSPFGWLYYFPLLLMPLTMIWQSLCQEKATPTNKIVACGLSVYF
jgi:hypothetical protein